MKCITTQLFTMIFMIFGVNVYSQEQELKNITPEDYHKWYHLGLPVASNNGSWIGYKLNYAEGADTLIINHTESKKNHILPNSSSFTFIGKKWASFKDNQSLIHLINLINGKQEKLPDVSEIIMNDKEDYLILYKKEKEEIIIRDLLNNSDNKLKNVYDFSYNIKSDSILLSLNTQSGYAIGVFHLNNTMNIHQVLKPQPRKIGKTKWADNKNGFMYVLGSIKSNSDTMGSGILGYYDLKKNKRSELDLAKAHGFPKDYTLTTSRQFPLRISEDGGKIFFQYKRKVPLKYANIPELWKWDDPYIYKKMAYQMNWENTNMIGIWDIEKNQFIKLTDTKFPKAILSPNQEFALLYNPANYEPQPKLYPPIDLYLKNLETGQNRLLLKEHHNALRSLFFSPSGSKVIYFKEGIWWYYDLKRNKHFNLNQKLNTIRKRPLVYDSANKSVPPGWVEGEESIYMYDEFDLWEVPIGKGKPVLVTQGRDKGIHYKLITTPEIEPENKYSMGVYTKDQQLLFFLDTEDNMNFGYAIKKPNNAFKIISFKASYMYKLWQNSSKDGSVFTYREENNNVPPRIMAYDTKNGILDTVFQGNPHYRQFKHGRSKKVYYTNKHGDKLSGILRYPVDYNIDSLYPMVVYVYETQRQYFLQYQNPGMYNGVGYNPTNLVNEGYFVFLPDIEYKIGEPGFSAADCIISGTKAAIQSAAINPDKIALMGHSFGGYETLFTITQTNLFQTAISGSGNPDIIRSYLYLDNGANLNFDDYEFSQYRLGNSLFNDYQIYLDNSALYYAKNIQTPLLLWSGKEDFHVYYYQSISFHLALKRMGKKNTLLLYPEEGHVFLNKKNQKDLTMRLQQWLSHYLKDEPKQGWVP